MDQNQIIRIAENYINEAKKIFKFNEAYLFGSRLNEKHSFDSDIDIAFLLKNDIKTDKYFQILTKLYRLTENINVLIEPHIIIKSDKEPGLLNEIYQTGKKIA